MRRYLDNFISSFPSEDTLVFAPSQEEDIVDFVEESVSKDCDAGDDPLTKATMELI